MPETEIVEVVDENNVPLFEKPLGECLKEGLLHRAVAVFLKDSSGRLFLQRRSFRDDWMPGKWTCSCAGHVKAGETPDEAARRELGEELGLETSPQFLFRYLLPKIEFHGLVEHEISFVF
ncbi:MAG: NUDIX domain-containing protein [Nitrososphaerales archaeon]